MYPLLGAILQILPFSAWFSLQLLSATGLLLSSFFTLKTLEIYFPKENFLPFVFVLFMLSPIALKFSVLGMSDMFCTGLIMGAWFTAEKFKQTNKFFHLAAAAIFAVLAINTRYGSAVLLIVPAFIVFQTVIQKRLYLIFALASLIGALFFIPHFYFYQESASGFIHHSWLQQWNFKHFFKSSFTTSEGTLSYLFPNILFVFYGFVHPIYMGMGLILLFFVNLKTDAKKLKLVVITIAIYLLFLAGIPYQNKRFLLLALPFIVIFFAPAFKRFFGLLKLKLKVQFLFIGVLIFFQLAVFTYTFSTVLRRNKLEQNIVSAINNFPHQHLYGFDMDIAITSYGTNKMVHNLWQQEFQKFRRNSLVIFNEDQMAAQWSNKPPMNNWNRMNQFYEIRKVKSFDQGWALYELR